MQSLAFPFGESGERMRADRGQIKILPCSKASPCLIVLAHNEAKIVCLVPRLPLGGKLSLKATDEGQLHFRFKILNYSAIPFSIFPLAFPFSFFLLREKKRKSLRQRESLPNCRSKAIPASRVARSAERGLPKFPSVLFSSIRYLRRRTLMLPDMLRKQLSFLRRQRAPFLRKIIA